MLILLAACQKVEVEPVKYYSDGPYTYEQNVRVEGTNLYFGHLGYLRNNLSSLTFRTTPAGHLDFTPGADAAWYKPTNRFLVGDSVSIWEGSRLRILYRLIPNLLPGQYAQQQSPLYCPTGQTIQIDLNRLTQTEATRLYMDFKGPRLGQATLAGGVVTYTAGAASGVDTLSYYTQQGGIMALRVLVGDAADGACLNRLDMRPDTVSLSKLIDSSGQIHYYAPVSLTYFLANDDYCAEYLDLTSFRLLTEDGYSIDTYTDSAYAYRFQPNSISFRQSRNLSLFYPSLYYSPGRTYQYRIATIGGVKKKSTITFIP